MKRFPSEVISVSKAVARGGVSVFEMGVGIISYFGTEGMEMGNKGEK